MKTPALALTTLLALSGAEAILAKKAIAQVSPQAQVVQLAGWPNRHYPGLQRRHLRRRGLGRRFPIRRQRILRTPRLYRRRYVRRFPAYSDPCYAPFYQPHRVYRRPYRSRRRVKVRSYRSYRSNINPSQLNSSSPSRIHINTVPAQIETYPAAFLGPEGQYDEQGLAKRISLELNQDPELAPLLTSLDIEQNDSQILIKGEVPSQDVLNRIVDVAEQEQGLEAIDVQQVTVLTP